MKPEQDLPELDSMSLHPSALRRGVVPRLEDSQSEGERHAATARIAARPRMTTVREVFHQQRLARQQHRVWLFYREHNLFDQARESRRLMLLHLRLACRQWRLTLQGALEDGSAWRQEGAGNGQADLRSAGTTLG